jgi:hypothetical protein
LVFFIGVLGLEKNSVFLEKNSVWILIIGVSGAAAKASIQDSIWASLKLNNVSSKSQLWNIVPIQGSGKNDADLKVGDTNKPFKPFYSFL